MAEDVPAPGAPLNEEEFRELYAKHERFVRRNLRRLGVPDGSLEDALQDAFLVVHRRLGQFEGRSSLRTWMFGIVLRVASRYRRATTVSTERMEPAPDTVLEELGGEVREGPHEFAVRHQSAELLHKLLDTLNEDKRTILIMVDLEQMSVVEAAEVLQINLNTAHTRLRAARQEMARSLARYISSDRMRQVVNSTVTSSGSD